MTRRPYSIPEDAEHELRAAGYAPLEPYPGTARQPWLSRCTGCGQHRTPNLATIRAGSRCHHTKPRPPQPVSSASRWLTLAQNVALSGGHLLLTARNLHLHAGSGAAPYATADMETGLTAAGLATLPLRIPHDLNAPVLVYTPKKPGVLRILHLTSQITEDTTTASHTAIRHLASLLTTHTPPSSSPPARNPA